MTLRFLYPFKMSLRALKRVLSVSLVFGAIAFYTGFQAGPVIKEELATEIKNQFRDAKIQQTSDLGAQIILAYNRAIGSPSSTNINKLYNLVDAAQSEGRSELESVVTGEQLITASDKAVIASKMGMLDFSENKLRSSFLIFSSVAIILYLTWVAGRAIWLCAFLLFQFGRNRIRKISPQN